MWGLFPTLVFIPLEGKPAISPGAPDKSQLKEIIDDKLLGNGSKVEASSKIEKEEKEDPITRFNKIIAKIKRILNWL